MSKTIFSIYIRAAIHIYTFIVRRIAAVDINDHRQPRIIIIVPTTLFVSIKPTRAKPLELKKIFYDVQD